MRALLSHAVPSGKREDVFCRAHNQLQAKKDFGEEHVTKKQVVSALINLGYSRKQAEAAVHVASEQRPGSDLRTLLRECLRLAGKTSLVADWDWQGLAATSSASKSPPA